MNKGDVSRIPQTVVVVPTSQEQAQMWRYVTEGRKQATREEPHAGGGSLSQHLDLEITQHFDQLRRDLTTTIERAHERSDKQNADAMQRLLLEMETFVKDSVAERRRRPR